jgi:hypothetical protein
LYQFVRHFAPLTRGFLLDVLYIFDMNFAGQVPVTVTINKGDYVIQHDYQTTLGPQEFEALMVQEWMIEGDDSITVEPVNVFA